MFIKGGSNIYLLYSFRQINSPRSYSQLSSGFIRRWIIKHNATVFSRSYPGVYLLEEKNWCWIEITIWSEKERKNPSAEWLLVISFDGQKLIIKRGPERSTASSLKSSISGSTWFLSLLSSDERLHPERIPCVSSSPFKWCIRRTYRAGTTTRLIKCTRQRDGIGNEIRNRIDICGGVHCDSIVWL